MKKAKKHKKQEGMTYEELMEVLKKHKEEREAFQRGEIEDPWDEECRQNWTEKCNA